MKDAVADAGPDPESSSAAEGEVEEQPYEQAGVGEQEPNLTLFRYLAADEPLEYLAIMRVMTGTLRADLSATQVASAVTAAGHAMEAEIAEARCQKLVAWGNLVRSVRDTRVATIAAYQRSRSRYQVSKLGGQVQRDVDRVLSAADGAREVAREMLGRICGSLDRILVAAGGLPNRVPDPDELAGHVTGVFADHRLFTESVTDFYAYLSGVLTRYDLAGEEYARFKDLLLGYVDLIAADVARNAPAILDRLTTLLPLVDDVIDALPVGLTDGGHLLVVERLPGRTRDEWEELAGWYGAGESISGPEQLRTAAGQALRQLLANARRILTPSGTGVTRRADFLKLAGWFASADRDTAARVFDAAFGAWPSRHLALGPDAETPSGRPTDSWWDSDPVDVPVTMREHGDRTARGRSSRVPDMRAVAAHLLAQERAHLERRRQAAAELAAAGNLHGARISPLARDLLLRQLSELLTPAHATPTALGAHDAPLEFVDLDLDLVLTATPTPNGITVVSASDGTLTIDGLAVTASRPADVRVDDAEEVTA